jgi:RNA polymerase sigma-70 factor, ECF subfamily
MTDLHQRVRRYIRRRLNDAHLADDLSQDVMLKLHEHRDRLPAGPERQLAWALRTARNRVIDHYRARRPAEPLGEPATTSEARSPARELAACLPRMLQHLPEPYRQAVELADLQGHSQQAIADQVGLSLPGVKSRVQRGRQRLGELLRECCTIEQSAGGAVVDFDRTVRSAGNCGESENSCIHSA